MEKPQRKRKWLKRLLIALGLLVLVGGGFFAYSIYRLSLVPDMSYDDVFTYMLEDNEKAVVTVGILKDGQESYTVYGNNGKELPKEEHVYEIGSVTKTFTTSLLAKAILEGKAGLDDPVSQYISLPEGGYYPNFRRLVSHTSGYKNYYWNGTLIQNMFKRVNALSGIDRDTIRKEMADNLLEDKDYPYVYSNFGMSVVGLALERVYQGDYTDLMNDYVTNDLQLKNTRISDGSGDLSGYWTWEENDGYLPAGALVSTIGDTMRYVRMNINEELPYLAMTHAQLSTNEVKNFQYEQMGIHMDGFGMGWVMDKKNNLIWHNGGTSNFNSYVAFDKEKKIGVVILSNLGPNERIPATVMGIKLMQELQQGKQ